MNSTAIQTIYFDDTFLHITFGHIYTDTFLLQPGRYIASLFDAKWYTGIIMDRCIENNDAKVKFMRCNRLYLSWYEHDNNLRQSKFSSIATYSLYCSCTTFAQQKHGTIIGTEITGPFRRFSRHMWQNTCVNTVRRAMVCDVYFPFFLKSYNFIEGIMCMYIVFLKNL